MNIRIDDFERVVFFTGAGISAESGIPRAADLIEPMLRHTFRGAQPR